MIYVIHGNKITFIVIVIVMTGLFLCHAMAGIKPTEAWWCTYPFNRGIIISGNGLSPFWCQDITWTNAENIGPRSNLMKRNQDFPLQKMNLKISFAKLRPFWWGSKRLTHWGRDEIDIISQTTFLNVCSSMKMFEFRLKFHWRLFLGVQLTTFQHWFR